MDPTSFNRGRQLLRELVGAQLAASLDDRDVKEALVKDLDGFEPQAMIEGQGLIVRILEDWAIRESRLTQDSDFPLAVDQKTPEQEARVMGSSLGPIRPSR